MYSGVFCMIFSDQWRKPVISAALDSGISGQLVRGSTCSGITTQSIWMRTCGSNFNGVCESLKPGLDFTAVIVLDNGNIKKFPPGIF